MPERRRGRTPREALLFAEAMVMVALAAPAIRIMPFRWIGRLASWPLRRRVADDGKTVALVTWAVRAAARRSPLRALCFERGLAAQIMLRRRGIASVLHYGVAPGRGRPLDAHVWVTHGEVNVSGADLAADYARLAHFPAR